MVNELNKEMSNYQRFLSGEYCNCLDAEVLAMINRTKDYLCVLNDIKTVEYERKEILSIVAPLVNPIIIDGDNATPV